VIGLLGLRMVTDATWVAGSENLSKGCRVAICKIINVIGGIGCRAQQGDEFFGDLEQTSSSRTFDAQGSSGGVQPHFHFLYGGLRDCI